MRKYSEQDIEKMLYNTEKTDAKFDKKVDFPVNNIIYKRRRFASLMIAACLAVFIVSGSLLVAFLQNEGTQSDFPDYSSVSGNGVDDPDKNENSNSYNESNISGLESYPNDNSGYESGNDSGGDETRNPYGEGDNSDEQSDNSNDVSGVEPLLPQIAFPDDYKFFLENGMGELTAEEYFALNPNKNLKNDSKISVYSRSALGLAERKQQIEILGKSFGVKLLFDEERYKKSGECVGINNDASFGVNVSEYGDWYLYSDDDLLYVGARSEEIASEIQRKVNRFINDHRDVFGGGAFKISQKFASGNLEVYITEITEDKILSNTPQYVLTFEKVGTNDFYLTAIKRNIVNINLFCEYPILSYNEALEEFFKQPITEDYHPDTSEPETLDCVLVGHDVRYLYSSDCAGMYPFYAFVIKFDPYGKNPRYKAFFVPAIDDEYIISQN